MTTAVTGARCSFVYGYSPGENGWGVGGYTPMAKALDALFACVILNQTTNAPPGSPAPTDSYIVGPAPTGAWAGKAGDIAAYQDTGWAYYPPKKGLRVLDASGPTLVYYNGAAWVPEAVSTAQPYDMGSYVPGILTANQVVLRFNFTRAVTFPIALAGSQGSADVAATASTVFQVRKAAVGAPNTFTNIGTITFAAAAVTPTFAMTSAYVSTIGDVLEIVAPATPDVSLAGVSFTLTGTR